MKPFSARAGLINNRSALSSSGVCRAELFMWRMLRITIYTHARVMPKKKKQAPIILCDCLPITYANQRANFVAAARQRTSNILEKPLSLRDWDGSVEALVQGMEQAQNSLHRA